MKNLSLLCLLALLAACSVGIKESEKTIEYANAAYDQFELQKSRKILEAILLTDNVQNDVKCEALRKLAHQDWKYYQDYQLALKKLLQADSIGKSRFDTWQLISRIEREAKNFNQAKDAAFKAKELARVGKRARESKNRVCQKCL